MVGWALLGRPLDDAGMLDVLAPYRPQRQRAVRYVEVSGFRRPRFGPRFSPKDYRAVVAAHARLGGAAHELEPVRRPVGLCVSGVPCAGGGAAAGVVGSVG